MANPPDQPGRPTPASGGRVSPLTALAFTTILFAALVIAGLGILSLVTGRDVIAVRGFGEFPATIAVFLAVVVFAATLWPALRRERASLWAGAWTATACFLIYLVVVGIGGFVHTADPVLALAVMGRLITAGFALVVAAAGLVCAWAGIVLVHRRGRRPRWPWERDTDV